MGDFRKKSIQTRNHKMERVDKDCEEMVSVGIEIHDSFQEV